MTSLEMQIDQLTIEDQTNETNEINELKVKYIRHNRSKPRFNGFLKNKDNLDDWDHFCYENNCIGSLAFDVIWEDNSESREPLQSFITYNSISNEYYINGKILAPNITSKKANRQDASKDGLKKVFSLCFLANN